MSGITRFRPVGVKTRDFFMWDSGNSGFRGSSRGISTVDVTRFRDWGRKRVTSTNGTGCIGAARHSEPPPSGESE